MYSYYTHCTHLYLHLKTTKSLRPSVMENTIMHKCAKVIQKDIHISSIIIFVCKACAERAESLIKKDKYLLRNLPSIRERGKINNRMLGSSKVVLQPLFHCIAILRSNESINSIDKQEGSVLIIYQC